MCSAIFSHVLSFYRVNSQIFRHDDMYVSRVAVVVDASVVDKDVGVKIQVPNIKGEPDQVGHNFVSSSIGFLW